MQVEVTERRREPFERREEHRLVVAHRPGAVDRRRREPCRDAVVAPCGCVVEEMPVAVALGEVGPQPPMAQPGLVGQSRDRRGTRPVSGRGAGRPARSARRPSACPVARGGPRARGRCCRRGAAPRGSTGALATRRGGRRAARSRTPGPRGASSTSASAPRPTASARGRHRSARPASTPPSVGRPAPARCPRWPTPPARTAAPRPHRRRRRARRRTPPRAPPSGAAGRPAPAHSTEGEATSTRSSARSATCTTLGDATNSEHS